MATFFTKTGGANPFEPKRTFRWVVSFDNVGTDATFMAKSAKKPSFAMADTEHSFLNHVFKFPTKVKWEDISVTFIDSFQADIGSKFYNLLRNMGYAQPEGIDEALIGVTKAGAVNALGSIRLMQLDGGIAASADPANTADPDFLAANIREEWVLKNAFIKGVKWGDTLDYTNDGLIEVSVDLTYDYATYTKKNEPYF